MKTNNPPKKKNPHNHKKTQQNKLNKPKKNPHTKHPTKSKKQKATCFFNYNRHPPPPPPPITHSAINGYFGRKEGNVLFNDTLNTFYLWLYGIRHMVKDHSDSEKGNPLLPHGLLFPISSQGFLYASSHRQDNTYHSLCYTSRGALAGTRNRIFWCQTQKQKKFSRSLTCVDPPAPRQS